MMTFKCYVYNKNLLHCSTIIETITPGKSKTQYKKEVPTNKKTGLIQHQHTLQNIPGRNPSMDSRSLQNLLTPKINP